MAVEKYEHNNLNDINQKSIDMVSLQEEISKDIHNLHDEVMTGVEKEKNNIRKVALRPDGKVLIPYDWDGKQYNVIVQKIGSTTKISLYIDHKEIGKLDKLTIKSSADLREHVGTILDTYVDDKDRTPIPAKVDKAYELLLIQDKIISNDFIVDRKNKTLTFRISLPSSADKVNNEYEFIVGKQESGGYYAIQDKIGIVIAGNKYYTGTTLDNVLSQIAKEHKLPSESPNVYLNTTVKNKLADVKEVYDALL